MCVLGSFLEPFIPVLELRYWYIFDVAEDAHSLVSLEQLLTWGSCQDWQGFRVNNVGGISSLVAPMITAGLGSLRGSHKMDDS